MATETRRVQFDFFARDRVSQTLRTIGEESSKLDSKMTTLAGAAGALAGPAAAAGAAFVGFAAVAAPSIGKVISAQEDLTKSWGDLSQRQKESALIVQGLADDFKGLSRAYEPQALAAFNTVVGTARGLLPQFTTVVDAGAIGVQNLISRLAAFAEGPEVASFLQFTADTGPAALDEFGQAASTSGAIALRLVQDMAPLGLSMLELANGTLSAVNAAASWNPALAQMAVTTLLLRGPVTSVAGGIGNMAARMRDATGPMQNLSRGQKALNLLTAAGPNLYLTAGVALGFLAVKAATAKSSQEKFVESLKATYKATGNNVDGYQQLIATLQPRLNDAMATSARLQREVAESGNAIISQTGEHVRAQREATETQREMNKAIAEAEAAQRKVIAGGDQLARTYGISRDAALRLATAAGVDLTKSMDDNGRITAQATLKIDQYKQAAEQANDPTWVLSQTMKILNDATSTAEKRTQALTAAYQAELGPAIAAVNANLQLKDGYAQLTEQLNRANAGMGGNSQASRQLQEQLVQQIDTVWKLYAAKVEENGTTTEGTAAVRKHLPVLYALAGSNEKMIKLVDTLARSTYNVTGVTDISRKAFLKMADAMGIARDRADKLWDELKKIKDRKVDILVNGKGNWSVGGAHPEKKFPGMADGGPVPWVSGAEPGKDSVPALLMPDEHVWTRAEVRAAGGHEAVERLRGLAMAGQLKGYAKGGPVSMTSPRISGAKVAGIITEPIRDGMWGLVASIGREMGRQWKAYVASGGPVVAAARSMVGYPYSWGGGGKGGPSYGIGRGAGTYGFDCSGLTQYAWWKGRGIDIGSTTYSQHPGSRAIGTPRPGALGFPHLGHVVIASNRPGYVIQAPYTGSHVQEVRSGRGYDWRWPRAAFYAGGPVKRLGELFTSGQALEMQRRNAKLAGIAGDTARPRARGGPVAAGLPYLVGEQGPEVMVPRTSGTVHRSGSNVVVQNINVEVKVPLAYQKGQVGQEIAEALRAYKAKGGTLPT